jgi:hypothetical protein
MGAGILQIIEYQLKKKKAKKKFERETCKLCSTPLIHAGLSAYPKICKLCAGSV